MTNPHSHIVACYERTRNRAPLWLGSEPVHGICVKSNDEFGTHKLEAFVNGQHLVAWVNVTNPDTTGTFKGGTKSRPDPVLLHSPAAALGEGRRTVVPASFAYTNFLNKSGASIVVTTPMTTSVEKKPWPMK